VAGLNGTPAAAEVRAAGGVVWRRRDDGAVEVVLVHRPRYDDWSLPKGKLAPGEPDREGALREVEEETGLRCVVGPELATTSYRDSAGRAKRVRYWAMTPLGGGFAPNHEVDQARWVTVEEALGLLSYDRDREVLASLGP
jgi:8-oxo-dGTP diphosphatase